MRNPSDEEMYFNLIDCDGGITGEFSGWSELGKSAVNQIYAVLPEDEVGDVFDDDDNGDTGGCYVGDIRLPTRAEVEQDEASGRYTIELLTYRTHRPPTQLVVYIAPQDYVELCVEQHEVYQLIDAAGNVIPLESLFCGGHQP
jgi:hypothetical protein